jgi:hypothetical protein
MDLSLLLKMREDDTLDAPVLPQRKLKTMIVAANRTHEINLQRQYADVAYMTECEIKDIANGSREFFVISPGNYVGGRRFKNIIVQARVLESLKREAKLWDWYQECVLTRLVPGGEVKIVH